MVLFPRKSIRCIDLIIDRAGGSITESLIKQLHQILKSGTSDSRLEWFAAGEYKRIPNEVGGKATTAPEDVLLPWVDGMAA